MKVFISNAIFRVSSFEFTMMVGPLSSRVVSLNVVTVVSNLTNLRQECGCGGGGGFNGRGSVRARAHVVLLGMLLHVQFFLLGAIGVGWGPCRSTMT